MTKAQRGSSICAVTATEENNAVRKCRFNYKTHMNRKHVAAIGKLFNSSHLLCRHLLGHEFLQAVTKADFSSRESSFCMVRAMLVCCNLSFPQVQDGFSRLLARTVEKLKAGREKNNLLAAEKLALLLFDEAKANLLANDNVKLLGRFLIGAGLHLVKK